MKVINTDEQTSLSAGCHLNAAVTVHPIDCGAVKVSNDMWMEKRNVVEEGRTPPEGVPDDWDKEAIEAFVPAKDKDA